MNLELINVFKKAQFIHWLLLITFIPVHSQEIEKVVPFSNESVTLAPSWIKLREDLNIVYLQSLDADRLLHNFRVNAGLHSNAIPLDGWESPDIGLRGHFVGHYLSAIAKVSEKYNDTLLSKTLAYMVDELYKCQQRFGNGYLSAFPENEFDTLETKFEGVWAPYYTYHKIMQGLLDTYTCTGNKRAYEMVLGMASYVEKRMSRLNGQIIEKILYSVGANPPNEAGAMNEVLYKLYRISKDPKHLNLAKIFDRDWFAVPLSKNIDILSGLHANTHLVLVNGFAQRYAITKEQKYHDAVAYFWRMLMSDHAYANGSSSGPRPNVTIGTSLSAEHWGVPGHLSSTMTKETSESCVSHNTQKLTSALFTWTTNPMYADAYMNTFYNAILALQSRKSGKCVYHLPLGSPRNKSFLKETDFRCCNGSTIEAFSSLNSTIYYHNDTSLWVNLYVPSKVNWDEKGISLQQKTNFPVDTCIEFTVSANMNSLATFNFLIPSWAQKVEVFVNNEKMDLEAIPASYLNIKRRWRDNDKIKIAFQFDFYLKTMPDDKNILAVYYGPSLLAFEYSSEIILKGDLNKILNGLSKDKNTFRLINNGNAYQLCPLYDIDEQSYGVYATLRNY